MRRFYLVRSEDPSGVSGVGVVAGGVEFPDGRVALRWFGAHPSTVAWDSMADAMATHGHGGKTKAVYVDDVPADEDAVRYAVGMVTTVHLGPDKGQGLTRCCGRPPFELPTDDRITYDELEATCGPLVKVTPKEATDGSQ